MEDIQQIPEEDLKGCSNIDITSLSSLALYLNKKYPTTKLKQIGKACSSLLYENSTQSLFSIAISSDLIGSVYEAYEQVESSGTSESAVKEAKDRLFEGILKEVDAHCVSVEKRLKSDKESPNGYHMALSLYLQNLSEKTISQVSKVPLYKVKHFILEYRWSLFKKKLSDRIKSIVLGFAEEATPLTSGMSVEDQLRPIVSKMQRKVTECLDSEDMRPQDVLKYWIEVSRLLAQLSGEMVQKQEINVTSTKVYEKILTMNDSQFEVLEGQFKQTDKGIDLIE